MSTDQFGTKQDDIAHPNNPILWPYGERYTYSRPRPPTSDKPTAITARGLEIIQQMKAQLEAEDK